MPLAVWPCAPTGAARPDSSVAREIARRAIAAYSDPGDLILDPHCIGRGDLIVEAIRQGRHALALVGSERERVAVRARLGRARARGATGEAEFVHGHMGDLPSLVARRAGGFLARHRSAGDNVTLHPCGSVDLIFARANCGNRGGSRDREWLWRHCASLLRPGGFLILRYPARSTPAEHSSMSVRVCQELGLQYWQHVIALLVPIRGGRLDPRLEPAVARDSGEVPLAVHADLLVFRKPTAATVPRTEADAA